MDNGSPWGTQSNLPSALGLWLVGLGIGLIYSRPARSTDNAVVERSHGVLAAWVAAITCADFAECQQRLEWAVTTQRERYRFCGNQTRLEAYPLLQTNLRNYGPEEDSRLWSLDRVRRYLAKFRFQRKVGKYGQVTLFANTYSVGRAYARPYILIHFDELTDQWVITDESGQDIRRHPAKELTYAQISQLILAKRRKK